MIAGDIETTLDAQRIAALNVPVIQATTGAFGGACHLDASTTRQAIDQLDPDDLDLLFIENVGNLVCPAEFDIGQSARVVIFSVTEGDDKPLKYPLAFSTANLTVIRETDLIPHLDLDMTALRGHLRQVNMGLRQVELSARSGDGVDSWIGWIHGRMKGANPSSDARAKPPAAKGRNERSGRRGSDNPCYTGLAAAANQPPQSPLLRLLDELQDASQATRGGDALPRVAEEGMVQSLCGGWLWPP